MQGGATVTNGSTSAGPKGCSVWIAYADASECIEETFYHEAILGPLGRYGKQRLAYADHTTLFCRPEFHAVRE